MQWRRRNYLINKDFQLRYVARLMFGILAMALVVAVTLYYTTWARIMDEFYNVPRIASQFAPLFQSVNQNLVLMLSLFLLAAAVLAIFLSHAIAGPMFRFEQTMRAVAMGDLTLRIGLRKSDEFKPLAELLNEMIGSLRGELKQDARLVEETTEILRKLQAGGAGKKGGSSAEMTKVNANLLQLRQNMKRFKLE